MIQIDGSRLSFADVVNVARYGERVELSEAGRQAVQTSRHYLDTIVATDKPVYGINTGFGIFADQRIPRSDSARLSRNLIISHAVGTGPALPDEVVRAAMLVRANTLAKGFSGVRVDGSVYGHGVMDMKAALACQIVAIEAVRESGLPVRGTLSMAAVADHMGDQLGSIAYFDAFDADLCVLGELTGNQVCLGHRGRYYFDVTTLGRSAHTCHKPQAINANVLAAQAVLALDASKYEPDLEPWIVELFGSETYVVPGRIYGGLAPGGPSMIPDECVIRVDCRPQPGVTVDEVRAEIDRRLEEAARADPRFRAEVVLADVKSGYLAASEDEVVRLMRTAVREVRGAEPPLVVENWLGDTASFGEKVPTVIFGPGGPPVYCPDEHLTVEEIEEATKVYALFAALALTPAEGA